MTTKDLRDLRNRSPFKPFNFHLSDGTVLPCLHAELLSFPATPDLQECVLWVGGTWHWIDVPNIVQVTPLQPPLSVVQ